MLRHLHIRNFAIVPALEQDFESGFTAISGETGAGKSILVDALGLLLGDRSDSSWVRSGADKAELTADFGVGNNHAAQRWLAEQSLDSGEDCLLRRTIQAGGRSRAWINGTPVTVQQLAALGNLLVELHGQNEHIRLATPRRQLELLDESGAHPAEYRATEKAHATWRALAKEFEALEQAAALTPGEQDYLALQHRELVQAALPAEAVERLVGEHRLLSASGDLLEALSRASGLLEDEQRGVATTLGEALGEVERFAALDPRLGEARDLLKDARIHIDEALAGIHAARRGVDLSPERLAEVDRRLSELNGLARKHQVEMEALESVRDALAAKLEACGDFEARRAGLQADLDAALATYRAAAARLSKKRAQQADSLSGAVQKLMGELGMPGGVFRIGLRHEAGGTPSRQGNDHVAIDVSANPGVPPAPLAKVASGGELARISLALKAACAGAPGRTQIFDEIDSGVGGETANAVGRLLAALARGGQALCVTHLAQVAACADHQLAVLKDVGADYTDVGARVLGESDRVEEIARMLGGTVSEQSRAHAQELLKAARAVVH